MNKYILGEQNDKISDGKNHKFGPCLNDCHMNVKNLEKEPLVNKIVAFKPQNEVIIVENWKKYNLEDSHLKKKKNECCTIF